MFYSRRFIKPFVLAASGLIGFLAGAGSAFSQEAIEEVVVRGIRKSQTEALGIKKDNVNFVDAISAEDVGKLPDRNIAEALQRVPGVAIQRERGEGDFVSIRALGPDFVRGTINGRTYTSGTEAFDSTLNGAESSTTGRATNFDVLPSEIIDTLEVYKSASAEQVEGGIGGTVNIKTVRPMSLGNRYGGTLRGQYGDFSKETDPSGSAFYSWSNDDNFGILTAVSYSERSIREDLANTFGYWNGHGYPGVTFAPFSANPEIFLEERERTTVNSTLQWLLGEDTEVVADVLWSERKVSSNQFGVIVSTSIPFGNPLETTICDDVVPCPGAVIEGDTLVSYPITNRNITPFTDVREGGDESLNLGLNIDHQVGAWNFSGDVSYADASGDLGWNRSVSRLVDKINPPAMEGEKPSPDPADIRGTVSVQGGAVAFMPDGAISRLTDPAGYALRQNEIRNRDNSDEEWGVRLDLAYEPEDSGIALKVGSHWRSREKVFDEFVGRNSLTADLILATEVPNSMMSAPGNFLDGDLDGISPSDMLFPDHKVVLAARGGADSLSLERNSLEVYVADEETIAAYLQVDFKADVADMELSGNAGVRYVHTELDIVGQSQQLSLVETASGVVVPVLSGPVGDFPFSESYQNFLPSLNLRLDINDKLLARFSYGKTLTRPEFTQLAPSLGVTNASQRLAKFGNPGLKPYLADNIDFGLEWYFDEAASALTAAVFYKDVDDYVADSSNIDVTIASVTFNRVDQPDNQGAAELLGLEMGYTHALTFLPAPFDGLGVIFNLTTLIDSKLELNNGEEIPFVGVSDLSVNSAVYYDKGPVQVRLAYSWRDEFLFDASDVFGTSQLYYDDYGQMDFSASYDITDNFTAFVDVTNLTDEQEQLFVSSTISEGGFSTRPLSLGQVGRRIGFGVRGRF